MKNARTKKVSAKTPVLAVTNSQFGFEESTTTTPRGNDSANGGQTPINLLVAGLENASNITVTENLALAYKSTLSHLLDFFGNAGALRKRDDNEVIQYFTRAFAEDRLLALKCLFYIRDRQGQGERRTFRVCMKWLSENYPEIFIKNIKNIPFYGRFDDLYCVF